MNRLTGLLLGMLFGYATLAHAGFSISGTRVIYHEAEGEATVHMQRTSGGGPVLLQVWLDDGDPMAKPGMQDLPFILTPAVSRVDPDRAQVIRILRVRNDLPTDRESLLFFNALEVPASADTDQPLQQASHLRLAMQARMKFFYRPKGLQVDVEQAVDLLRFTLEPSSDGQVQLRLYNPTPYHITIPKLALHASANTPALAQLTERAVVPMIAPFDELRVSLQPASKHGAVPPRLPTSVQVRYAVINDMGGLNEKSGILDDAS